MLLKLNIVPSKLHSAPAGAVQEGIGDGADPCLRRSQIHIQTPMGRESQKSMFRAHTTGGVELLHQGHGGPRSGQPQLQQQVLIVPDGRHSARTWMTVVAEA